MATAPIPPEAPVRHRRADSTHGEAFLALFREFKAIDGGVEDKSETLEYEVAQMAWNGAEERCVWYLPQTADEAAIAALLGFSRAGLLLDGFYSTRDIDEEERRVLEEIRAVLRNLWRFHDRRGGKAPRDFAKYLGASELCDTVAWEDGK